MQLSPPDVAVCPFRVVVDTREQAPFSFTGFRADAAQKRRPLIIQTISACLKSGDYSIEGFEDHVAVERKSLADLYSTLGQGRERFERELERLSGFDFAAVVVEADWPRILSAPCSACGGSGMILQPDQEVEITVDAAWVQRFSSLLVADALRVAVRPAPEITCTECGGAGKQHPLGKRSKLNPKTVYRSVLAWQQRYPNIHWWTCETRTFAEHTTFRILERYWKEQQG